MQPTGYDALRNGAAWRVPDDRGWIAVGGADRARFLQGLLTNDVVALAPGTGCYAAYLTPQGRMIADMHLLAEPDRIVVDLHRDVKEYDCRRNQQDDDGRETGEARRAARLTGVADGCGRA